MEQGKWYFEGITILSIIKYKSIVSYTLRRQKIKSSGRIEKYS